MSDLISRQAAIDFVDAGHLVNPNEPRWSDNEVVNFLKSRPSAQPDLKETSFTHKALDTISRQQAIDALDEIESEVADGYGFQYEKWRKYLTELPSAQPDLQPTCNQLATDCISRQGAIDAIVKCTNCNTPEVLREYVAEHSLWLLWSGGVLEALEAVEGLPSAPLYTPDELQTMQDLEWAQMEKMYELGKAEHKKGKWVGKEQFTNSPEFYSWQCSVCGCVLEDPTMDKPYPFCPNCGADMREGEQE